MSSKSQYKGYNQVMVNGQVWIYWHTANEGIAYWKNVYKFKQVIVEKESYTSEEAKLKILNELSNEPVTNESYRKYFTIITDDRHKLPQKIYIGYVPFEQAYMLYNANELNDAVQRMDEHYKALEQSKELYDNDLLI